MAYRPFLNEVLSITAQEYCRWHHDRGRPTLLNEVLSITAQELALAHAFALPLLSSMKS